MLHLLIAALTLSCSSALAEDKLTLTVDGKAKSWSLGELKAKVKSVTVEVDDPVYGPAKKFDGFPLLAVLALSGLDPKAVGDEVVFSAKDGYAPNTTFENLRKHRAILAYREHGNPKGFDLVRQGKAMVSPAPFYVVWEEGKALEKKVPWAYQLIAIEIVDFKTKFAKAWPAGAAPDSAPMRGFRQFKADCIVCHSMNLVGGDLGPELNAPRSVTEYWDGKELRAFIRDASSFRYRSKMPPFTKKTSEEIEDLVAYLSWMKDRKEKL